MPKKHPPGRGDGSAQFIGAEFCANWSWFDNPPMADDDAHVYFGFDERIHSLPLNMDPLPPFPSRTLEEDAENMVISQGDGKTAKIRKDGSSMPMFLDYPVHNREDFEAFKTRFSADAERFVAPPDVYKRYYQNRTFPLMLGGSHFCGFFSVLRECLGLEGALFGFYDQPDLMHEMLVFFTDFYIETYRRALSLAEVDFILIWEDMCYKNGPLVSPAIFTEFCAPYYKKFIAEMRRLGVKHFIVDTDGNCEDLIPHFLDVGVTGLYPFEVAAGMDIEKTRAEYPRLVMMGGIDKRALAAGKTEIDREVRKAGRVLSKGGYLPCVDHAVPPEVSLANYKYFRAQMDALLR